MDGHATDKLYCLWNEIYNFLSSLSLYLVMVLPNEFSMNEFSMNVLLGWKLVWDVSLAQWPGQGTLVPGYFPSTLPFYFCLGISQPWTETMSQNKPLPLLNCKCLVFCSSNGKGAKDIFYSWLELNFTFKQHKTFMWLPLQDKWPTGITEQHKPNIWRAWQHSVWQ